MSLPLHVPTLRLCPFHFVSKICKYIPPWIDDIQRVSLMQKFDRFLQQVDDRPFQVVDGVPFPDVACCEAMLDALIELLGNLFSPATPAPSLRGFL
jgi:hypothetical protein